MTELTSLLAKYREFSRSLWNIYFLSFGDEGCDWDDVESYEEICKRAFYSFVVERTSMESFDVSRFGDWNYPIKSIRVVPKSDRKIPILINRDGGIDNPNYYSGYWDDPTNEFDGEEAEVSFVNYFDFDKIGRREMEYCLVFIVKFDGKDHLQGRYALVRSNEIKFIFDQNA